MRKGYTIKKLHYLGGMLPGLSWDVTTPSGAIYRITRFDDTGRRDYTYGLYYSDRPERAPRLLIGVDDYEIKSKDDIIKIIYACEEHGGFELDGHGRLDPSATYFVDKLIKELGI